MHNIKFVSNQTGLSTHVIRAWERRYDALNPERTETNRRLYTDEDIEKLRLLGRAVQLGHSIGSIAALPTPELNRLLAKTPPERAEPNLERTSQEGETSAAYIEQALRAVREFDAEGLDLTLRRSVMHLGANTAVERVVAPLLEHIGAGWRDGVFRVSQEHMATAVLRTFLGRALDSIYIAEAAPYLVVATPSGQTHELGALMMAIIAASEGWRVLYLGASLPVEDIAGAARQVGAKGVALSVVYPPDDPKLPSELERLRLDLGEGVAILAGGGSVGGYREAWARIHATLFTDWRMTRSELEKLRNG